LNSGDSITHNRFVVLEWGSLRFDLHVPQNQLQSGRRVQVTLKATDGSSVGVSSFVNLERAVGNRNSYLADTQRTRGSDGKNLSWYRGGMDIFTVRELENRLNSDLTNRTLKLHYDFFSHVSKEIQDVIEQQVFSVTTDQRPYSYKFSSSSE